MMYKLSFAIVLLAVVIAVQNAVAKKKTPVRVKEGSFSDQEHFHDGKHDAKYDHDAFLGEDQANEMEKLSPTETKKRLRSLFVKMDVDGDKKLSRKELTDWIVDNMKKHVLKSTKMRMKELDKNKDGKASWDEYVNEQYEMVSIDTPEDKKLIEEMKNRDQKRFKLADSNDDGLLDPEELALFTHPEESARMTNLVVQENIEQLDKDGDGKINFEEYYGAGESEGIMKDEESLNSFRESFNKDLDKNHDGVLDNDEIRDWILPGGNVDPAAGEADHLMKEADLNKDNYLTVEEIIKNHELFSGSRVTAYGDLLKQKKEL
ncbi:calumenin-like [Actinia tenebrosa]|uniref:Reticulocalbin-3 n=1 Tax=Actinia tenebrosa TaxID=6105 RepID=A0A6P8HTJ0_ACTTE|nr:calumenin-like [Actinia tenebrosa]